ncbi:MAG: carboxypeptidase regulatory-like domain-containing protein [Bryobacteraceae bacterium]
MKGLRLGLIAWLALLPLHAAEIAVAGRAIDENDAGVAGVEVTAQNQAGEQSRATTDPTGGFKLTLPSEGQYLFAATQSGYLPVKNLPVDVRADMGEVYLILNHAKEVLQSVDVKASGEAVDVEQTQSERVLTGIQIMDIPYPSTHSLREAMALIPGQVEDATGGLHFDGGRENQTNYLLDGFNISDPLTGNLATTVSVEAVSSLDYLSGRYSPEYGQGSAGTLQIKTQTGDDQFRYSATNFIPGVSTFEGLHLGDWTPRLNFSGPLLRGRAWFSDNLDGDYNITTIPGLPRGENTTSTLEASNMLHTQVNVTPANILYADFLFNYQRATEYGLGALTPPSTTLDERGRTWFVGLKDQIYVAKGTLLELGFAEMFTLARLIPFGSGIYIITPNGNLGNNFIDSTRHSRRGQFLTNLFLPGWHLAGTHNLKMGVDVDRVDYAQGISRTGYNLYGVDLNLLRSVTFEGDGFLSRPNLTASSYLTDHWQARHNLFFEMGVRQDWDEILRRLVWSPRASFSYAPTRDGNTRISGGYAVLYDPTIIQLFTRPLDQYTLTDTYAANGTLLLPNALSYYMLPDEHLKAPLYQNWSLGVDHQFPWHIRGGLSLHRKRGGDGFAYVNTLAEPILAPAQIAEAYHASYVEQQFILTNARHDQYDAAQVIVHQAIGGRYEWMASYTRSRTHSNEVLDPSLEQTLLLGPDNSGPMPWDAPNRFLSWGYLPTWWKNWAIAYLFEERTGFPFSIQHDNGQLIGAPDSYRYPEYFNLNVHLEWRVKVGKYRFGIRGGVDNVTNHLNPTVVNNTLESPNFLNFYGSEGRHYVARLRWLGKE